MRARLSGSATTAAAVAACALSSVSSEGAVFGDDVAFLKAHTDVIVLSDKVGKAKVVLAPALQGRVMTSTAQGEAGASFGWINRDLFSAHKRQSHINVFGGEDRFWMGPEGGQFSIFFAPKVPFDLEHWFTPAALDTEPFDTVKHGRARAEFRRSFTLTNYSGVRFEVAINRVVELLANKDAWSKLGLPPSPKVDLVAFESSNRLRNAGREPWKPETGLLSIWILGMFNPTPATTIVVPIRPGAEAQLGKPVTSDYFGPIPPDRLAVQRDVIFFKADGKFRGKIGISPARSRGVLGSYDRAQKVLTVVQFSQPEGATHYVNSLWKIQDQPYAGDVANSYNDGPPTPGAKPLGPFYELESSSPAAELGPGKSLVHTHRTLHLTGPEAELDRVSAAVLGVRLEQIASAFAD